MRPNKEELEKYYQVHESERLLFRNLEKSDIDLWIPFFQDEETLSQVGMLSGPFKNMSHPERAALGFQSQWTEEKMARLDSWLSLIRKRVSSLDWVG
ncbi:MAG: hypothetical protein NXI10_01750 [bacterium]|nr:hypothetical protein [bacterium]